MHKFLNLNFFAALSYDFLKSLMCKKYKSVLIPERNPNSKGCPKNELKLLAEKKGCPKTELKLLAEKKRLQIEKKTFLNKKSDIMQYICKDRIREDSLQA